MKIRSKKPILLIILSLLSLICLVQAAAAATIVAAADSSSSSKAAAQYVCDGSGDQTQINAALASGGTVQLTEGTFYADGTISPRGNSVLKGQGPDKTVISMTGDYAARIDIAQDYTTVQDLKITNRGWLMIQASHIKVHNVVIQDSKKSAPTVNGMFFIWANGRVCEDIEFVDCKAIDVGSTGFNVNGMNSPRTTKNIRFVNCLALRCGNAGSGKIWAVGFDFHEGADLYDLQVINCRAEDNWESGFYFEPNYVSGDDPNMNLPIQKNSVMTNCVSVNNGWRNTDPTRFYLTGFYLSSAVTLNNCVAINNKNNGFWVWQSAQDVILNNCTDDGSNYAFQFRTGGNIQLNNCVSKNARTYGIYAWGSNGVKVKNFKLINPKKSTGSISLGLREDHPNDPWPVQNCVFEIYVTGVDPAKVITYHNCANNQISLNGYVGPIPTTTTLPGPTSNPTATKTPVVTIPLPDPTLTQMPTPAAFGTSVIPGVIRAADYNSGGEGVGYHDTTSGNLGGAYRSDDVDIENCAGVDGPVVGYMRPGEWLAYTVTVSPAGVYDATFKVASATDGNSFTVTMDDTPITTVVVPNTGSYGTFTTVKMPVWVLAGKHQMKVVTTGYHNLATMEFKPHSDGPLPTPTTTVTMTTAQPTATIPPSTHGATSIPGTILAANYDDGGEGVAYHDTTPGNQGGAYRSDDVDLEYSAAEGTNVLSYVRPGEWIRYTANVAAAGVYDASFRVSTPKSGTSFMVQVDGTDACMVNVPNTGSFDKYTTLVQQISLPAGLHQIRINFNGYDNLVSMRFQPSGGVPLQTPTVTQTPVIQPTSPAAPTSTLLPMPVPKSYGNGVIPGVIEAEDYNTGGEGVGYYDTTPGNSGGQYRNDDVDIEYDNGENSPVVCYMRGGEWLKYTVNVQGTTLYDVSFRVSSPQSGTKMSLQVDGSTVSQVTVPNTGSYNNYATVTKQVSLAAGPHVLKLMAGGYQNLNWIKFTARGVTHGAALPEMTANQTVSETTPLPTIAEAILSMTAPVTTVLPVTIPVTTEQPAPVETSAPVNITTPAITSVQTAVVQTTAEPAIPASVETQTQVPVSTALPVITQSAPVQNVTTVQTVATPVAATSVAIITVPATTVLTTTVPTTVPVNTTVAAATSVAITTVPATTVLTTTVPTTVPVNTTVIQTVTPDATVTEVPAPAGAPTYVPQPTGYALPGRIEAENFKDGGEGVGYHLTVVNSTGGQYRNDPVPVRYSVVEKGYLVNNLTQDAWLAYAVNAPVAGNYTLALQASSPKKTWVQVQLDGVDLCILEVPGTEVCALAKTQKPIAIPAGAHTLTLKPQGAVNLDYLQFS